MRKINRVNKIFSFVSINSFLFSLLRFPPAAILLIEKIIIRAVWKIIKLWFVKVEIENFILFFITNKILIATNNVMLLKKVYDVNNFFLLSIFFIFYWGFYYLYHFYGLECCKRIFMIFLIKNDRGWHCKWS